jgi:hypothetical protein
MGSFTRNLKKYNKNKCEFFGLLGIFHQFVLGLLILGLLILKRFFEKPRRPWVIWFFDVSKQIISSVVLYSINIIFSYLLSTKKGNSDLCTIYFMNLFLGCIVGYYITSLYIHLFFYLRKIYKFNLYINECYFEEIENNNNTKSYQIKTNIYLKELVVWTLIQLIWKFILLILFAFFKQIFIIVGDKCLKPLTNAHIRSLMILCVFPLVFNGFYYWKLDNLIKVKTTKKYVSVKSTFEEEKN